MMGDPRDYKLELSSVTDATAAPARSPRPYLSVHFACCGAYARIYRDPASPTYQGRCPRCMRPVRFAVGPGGTSARCFVVRAS